jgi:hypothetical protein
MQLSKRVAPSNVPKQPTSNHGVIHTNWKQMKTEKTPIRNFIAVKPENSIGCIPFSRIPTILMDMINIT